MPRIAGKTGANGVRFKRNQTQQERDAKRLSQVENRLWQHGHGNLDLTATQVTALRAIYDKLRPSLSAVEQTSINENDLATEEQLWQQVDAMVDASPDMGRAIVARITAKLTGKPQPIAAKS